MFGPVLRFASRPGAIAANTHKQSLCHPTAQPGVNPNEAGPRRLFQLVCGSGKPLVVHNGFIDLVYLYQVCVPSVHC
jgi:hypothetical protein